MDVITGTNTPSDRKELQGLFKTHLLPHFKPLVEQLQINAMGSELVKIIGKVTGTPLPAQTERAIIAALESKNGLRRTNSEYVKIILENVSDE